MNGKNKTNDPVGGSQDEIDTLLKILSGEEEPKKRIKSTKQESESHAYVTFLENDGKRLEKLADLFDHKLSNNYEFNQSEKLLENQLEVNTSLKESIIDYLLRDNHELLKSFFILIEREN